MNNNNYDSSFCGSLPIHLINHVQQYGVLLVLHKETFNILQVSENVLDFLGMEPKAVVNKNLGLVVAPGEYELLLEKFSKPVNGKIPVNLTLNGGKKFLALVQSTPDFILLELEPVDAYSKAESFIDVYKEIKLSMSAITQAGSTEEACNIAITELKRLSGFDKLMVYRFDEQWNGIVIAEVMEEGFDSYLGLHFPASDVPKQTRELYFKNPYRLIPDRDYTPVKIYPVINPITNGFIDLSMCNLRSVAAVHIEYLKNMGVTASMSTAIIKDGVLWGLIACHHKTAKYLSYEMCSIFELMAGIISTTITSIQNKESYEASANLQQVQSRLMEQVYVDDDPVAGLFNHKTTILDLLGADSAVMVYDKQFETLGKVPGKYEMMDLMLWLQNNQPEQVVANHHLSGSYDAATSFADVGSGVIVLPIRPQMGEYIIGFRPELIQQVNWGGNPNEAIQFEKDKAKYHPRNSFSLWQQTVKHTSLPWSRHEVQVAENFRNFLIEYTLKKVYA